MEYNSFYGGRQGTPFIIVKSYKTISAMEIDFNSSNCSVAYNEYVIIDTENKNHKDNGKIYRRVINEDGYEYIGQIVGPSGPAPDAEYLNYNSQDWSQLPTPTISTLNINTGDLVSGKTNDSISYKHVVVRDINNATSIIYMGFKIPYLVVDFSGELISPYNDLSNLVTREEPTDKPFYENWKIKIPQGIKGDSFKDLLIMVKKEDAEDFDPEEDEEGWEEPTEEDTRPRYLVYKYYQYNQSASGNFEYINLGAYNIIKDIQQSSEGIITVYYTHDESQQLNTNHPIKYIDSIECNPGAGLLTVNYNTKHIDSETGTLINDKESFILNFVQNVELLQNGTFIKYITNGSSTTPEEQVNKLTWVEDAIMDAGDFKVKKNTENTYQTLTHIKSIIDVEGANGYLKIFYNDETKDFIYQGMANATGAVIAEENEQHPESNPKPTFTEGSPWFVIEEIGNDEVGD